MFLIKFIVFFSWSKRSQHDSLKLLKYNKYTTILEYNYIFLSKCYVIFNYIMSITCNCLIDRSLFSRHFSEYVNYIFILKYLIIVAEFLSDLELGNRSWINDWSLIWPQLRFFTFPNHSPAPVGTENFFLWTNLWKATDRLSQNIFTHAPRHFLSPSSLELLCPSCKS